jgi:hypothetical protein
MDRCTVEITANTDRFVKKLQLIGDAALKLAAELQAVDGDDSGQVGSDDGDTGSGDRSSGTDDEKTMHSILSNDSGFMGQ